MALHWAGNRWSFQAIVGVASGHVQFDGSVPVQTNTWYHVAMTFDNAQLLLYVNGVLDGSLPVTGPILTTSGPLLIGGYGQGPWTLSGLVDEVSLYDTVLSGSQVSALYSAGSAGKCGPPQIEVQPQSQLGFWGRNATFRVVAAGASPLAYQWQKDGLLMSGATNDSLSLTNLQMTDAGAYAVVITNVYGTATSSPAVLTMNPAGVSFALYSGVTIEGVVGLTYGIQSSTDLGDPNSWRGIVNITLGAPSQLWFDTQPASQPRRYYRVVPGPISIP